MSAFAGQIPMIETAVEWTGSRFQLLSSDEDFDCLYHSGSANTYYRVSMTLIAFTSQVLVDEKCYDTRLCGAT